MHALQTNKEAMALAKRFPNLQTLVGVDREVRRERARSRRKRVSRKKSMRKSKRKKSRRHMKAEEEAEELVSEATSDPNVANALKDAQKDVQAQQRARTKELLAAQKKDGGGGDGSTELTSPLPAKPKLNRTRSGTIGPDQLGALQKAREADAAKHKHKHHKKKHSKKKADGGASQAERPALQRRRSGTLSIDGHAAVKKAAAAASK